MMVKGSRTDHRKMLFAGVAGAVIFSEDASIGQRETVRAYESRANRDCVVARQRNSQEPADRKDNGGGG